MRKLIFAFTMLFAVAAITWCPAFGQAVTAAATLQGTVTDQTGAVINGAIVTATNTATGATRTSTTSDVGLYRFEVLPPGLYDVKVTQPGFAAATASKVELFVQRTTTQNFSLKPGTETQTLEVTAEAPLLDQEKTSVGMEITPTQVENLPLNGRDFGNLAYLAPGVKAVT